MLFSLWFGSTSTPTMTPPGSDSDEPRPRCFSLFVLLFNDNIFNGRSRDPLDGCGVFGVHGCGLVGFVGAVSRNGSVGLICCWGRYIVGRLKLILCLIMGLCSWSRWLQNRSWWVSIGVLAHSGLGWLAVGLFCSGSGWFLVHPMVLGGGVWLPDGSGWLAEWLVVVFWVGHGGNGWLAMLGGGLRVCLLQTNNNNNNK